MSETTVVSLANMPQRRFSYSVLVSAVREANQLFRRDAGLLGIFAPQTKDLTFVFARSQSQRATLAVFWKDSSKTKIGDDEGMLTVRVETRRIAARRG